ncbi:hypothetical protein BV25DRAFT_220874 [Artomyces pyxidatus]|uniref:Uncharacterized protein n=1 Tax=Artomyces pyxidatus TaxID=48021 RepID=A0ACB8T9Y8_9AGAM|nr:hypothetical protein BV25DRAFT_220874 [Artomyces pyxidatus]
MTSPSIRTLWILRGYPIMRLKPVHSTSLLRSHDKRRFTNTGLLEAVTLRLEVDECKVDVYSKPPSILASCSQISSLITWSNYLACERSERWTTGRHRGSRYLSYHIFGWILDPNALSYPLQATTYTGPSNRYCTAEAIHPKRNFSSPTRPASVTSSPWGPSPSSYGARRTREFYLAIAAVHDGCDTTGSWAGSPRRRDDIISVPQPHPIKESPTVAGDRGGVSAGAVEVAGSGGACKRRTRCQVFISR